MKLHLIGLTGLLVLSLLPGALAEDPPQMNVECTGWHAVCTMATGCKVDGNTADCPCWRVFERHVVTVAAIKDDTFGTNMQEQTMAACTQGHPCGLDQAPVCAAIRNMLPEKEWVSTFSYRGWCKGWKPVKCSDPNGLWADCMTSPCSVSDKPQDAKQPLYCKCTVRQGAFVGTNGNCNSPGGTVMSTAAMAFWDFDNNRFAAWAEMPGNEYVQESCRAMASDPAE